MKTLRLILRLVWGWLGKHAAAIVADVDVLGVLRRLFVYFFSPKSASEPAPNIVPAPKIVVENSTVGTLVQGDGNSITNITNYQSDPEYIAFVDDLKARLNEFQAELKQTDDPKRHAELYKEITRVEEWVRNPRGSYDEHLKLRKDLDKFAERLKVYERDDQRIEQARAALEQRNFDQAKALFDSITEDQSLQEAVGVLAESHYGKGLVAAQAIRWTEAARNFVRAAELNPSIDHLLQASNYLHRMAGYQQGESLARKALEIALERYGEDHPSTAASYDSLAFNLDDQGQYSEAELLYRKALEIAERVLGEDHPDTAASYNNVASNLNAQGQYSEAELLYRKALDIRERVLGKDHPSTAASYNNVASNLNAQSQYSEAEPLYRQALEIWERVLGKEHPDTAASYNNVASSLNAQGRYSEAEPLYRQALEIWERVLGKDHPSTAASYNNVASNLDDQGRYSEAEPLYRQALEIRERVLGKEHPSTAASYNNVAFNLNAQGRYSEAELLYRKALEIAERVLGKEHPHTALFLKNLEMLLNSRP